MTRIKMLGLCLVAMFAVSAVAASASFAETAPEFFGKGAVNTTVGAVAFHDSSTTAYLQGQTSGLKVECTSSAGTGEVTGAKTTKHNLTTFKGCEIFGLAYPCENKGAGSKEIETKESEGTLGFVKAAGPGIELTPESGVTQASWECAGGGVLIEANGSLLGSLSGATATTIAAGKLATSMKLAFKDKTNHQEFEGFLGGPGGIHITSVVREYPSYTPVSEEGIQVSTSTIATTPAGQVGVTK